MTGAESTLDETFCALRALLVAADGLDTREDEGGRYDHYGTREVTVGRRHHGAMYFASLARRKRTIALYFFPFYTHADAFAGLDPAVRKKLKGKSCFHFTRPEPALLARVAERVDGGLRIYRDAGWI